MTGRLYGSISVCLPALNEAGNLPAMMQEVDEVITRRFDHVEVVVADDGSSDGTPEVLQQLQVRYPNLRVVRHGTNRGYGAACRSALGAAANELLLLTDADCQFDLLDVERLLEALPGSDAVIGWRVRRRDPRHRAVSGWLWSRLVNTLLGYTARDVNCAFKLIRRDVFQAIAPALRCEGAAFNAEFLTLARSRGFRISEMPVAHRPRTAGRPTGGQPGVVLRGLTELIRVTLSR